MCDKEDLSWIWDGQGRGKKGKEEGNEWVREGAKFQEPAPTENIGLYSLGLYVIRKKIRKAFINALRASKQYGVELRSSFMTPTARLRSRLDFECDCREGRQNLG